MKKPLLALLAVAAVAVVAGVVIMENTPERRMDRKLDRLLRSYEDDPKKLCKRLADDRDLLGFFLVDSFARYKGLGRYAQHQQVFDHFWPQIEAEFCSCGRAPSRPSLFRIRGGARPWSPGEL